MRFKRNKVSFVSRSDRSRLATLGLRGDFFFADTANIIRLVDDHLDRSELPACGARKHSRVLNKIDYFLIFKNK